MLEQQAQLGIQNTYKDLQKQLKGYFIELKNVPKLTKNIKNDKLRCISIDIETDSTVKIDQNQEKMDRMEYVRSISQTIQSMVPAVQTGVISKDALNEFIIFVSKPFKVGRNLENYLKVEEPIEEKPDPQAMLAQAEMQFRQQELQIKAQEVIGKLDLEQQKVNVDKAKVLNDQNKFEMQMEFDDVNKQADREAKRLDMKVKAGTELVNDQIRNANKPTKI
jgi:Cu/Ag efflux protein CusF